MGYASGTVVAALILGPLLVLAPQLLILIAVAGFFLARHRAKAHRFDTFVSEMLK